MLLARPSVFLLFSLVLVLLSLDLCDSSSFVYVCLSPASLDQNKVSAHLYTLHISLSPLLLEAVLYYILIYI